MPEALVDERPDLSIFDEADERGIKGEERLEIIRRRFPAMETLDWKQAFDHDIELVGMILRDILRSEQATPGRPGPRRSIDIPAAQPKVDRWMGQDHLRKPYTLLDFHRAFQLLSAGHSITQIARRVDLTRTQVFRLLNGHLAPSRQQMEQIAGAYGKKPSWFLEYRVGAITTRIIERLHSAPESSIRFYEGLFWGPPG